MNSSLWRPSLRYESISVVPNFCHPSEALVKLSKTSWIRMHENATWASLFENVPKHMDETENSDISNTQTIFGRLSLKRIVKILQYKKKKYSLIRRTWLWRRAAQFHHCTKQLSFHNLHTSGLSHSQQLQQIPSIFPMQGDRPSSLNLQLPPEV